MEKKNLFYRFKFLIMAIVLIPCVFAFSACGGKKQLSAYETAVENGFVGTEQEWLDSLKGLSAYEIAVKNGFVGTEQDWLNSLKGNSGKDAETVDTYELYLTAKEKENYTGTYLDFIKENLNIVQDNTSIAANKAVASVVSIDAYNGTKTKNPHSGSGIIFSLDEEGNAFIITNYHVTYDTTTASNFYSNYDIYLYGEIESNVIHATYVGGSKTYDIAVLYVEKSEVLKNSNAKAVTFDTENAKLGSSVLAIGNPSSYGLAVTKGIVSKDSEYVYMTIAGTKNRYRVLRHDAYITNGSSGGGLFDLSGNLIGVTNGGDGSNSLINYAIPANIVYNVAKNIISNCFQTDNYSLSKCNLGITLSVSSTETIFDKSSGYVKILDTVQVSEISSEAKTELFNLSKGDEILSLKLTKQDSTIYFKNITRLFDYEEFMLLASGGDTLEISYLSSGETKTILISLSSTDFSQIV